MATLAHLGHFGLNFGTALYAVQLGIAAVFCGIFWRQALRKRLKRRAWVRTSRKTVTD